MQALLAEATVDHLKALAWIWFFIGVGWIVLAAFWFAATRECAVTLRHVLKELRALRRKVDDEPPSLPYATLAEDGAHDDAAVRFLSEGKRIGPSPQPPGGRTE